ncbi:serine hydrolase domain-containing protein [Bartonella sp. HY761]|uniref:serine hydrolase domain-containing protein n=1 Tax=Bartonella sp. HY761 TaxID=2979330 RepID=UPI002208DC71|nr:serine hydrolase [Bartonella sp. HY761]UXN06291.1 beta-lactamase family protein [Bartonella sp. HY761]
MKPLHRRGFITGLASSSLILSGVHSFSQNTLTYKKEKLSQIIKDYSKLQSIRTIVIYEQGSSIYEASFNGASVNKPTNIKSASKSVVSALIGMAIDKNIIHNTDQKIADFLENKFPRNANRQLYNITIGDLLSMQSGLAPLSGPKYGQFAKARDKVAFILAQPFIGRPGDGMLYSTGSTHLLSAILMKASGTPTDVLAAKWFSPCREFKITNWQKDQQGIAIGGNEMAMTPHSMAAFGEIYRNKGRLSDGTQLISADWITQSWVKRTNSIFTGHGYGYCWFISGAGGVPIYYAWGYGGQMIFVVPDKALTVVVTSDPNRSVLDNAYALHLQALITRVVINAG